MRPCLWLIIGLVIVSCGTAAAAAVEESAVTTILAPPTFLGNSIALSPDGSTIAFASRSSVGQDEQYDLWTMKTDGTDMHKLTGMDIIDAISWHPDGSLLLFGGLRNGTYQAYTIQPDGENLLQITDGNGNVLPCGFDPTGTRILYLYETSRYGSDIWTQESEQKPINGTADLFITDLEGNAARRIVPDVTTVRMQVISFPEVQGYYTMRPAWISETRFIIPVTVQGKTDLYRYDTEGNGGEQLTYSGDCTWSDWNPDEQSLAYRSCFEVCLLQTSNEDNRALTTPTGMRSRTYYDYVVAWRPGADAIAYISYGDAWQIRADGSEKRQLTLHKMPSPITDIAWSPDGRFLYTISSQQIDRVDVSVYDTQSPDTEETVIELTGTYGCYNPSWSPDSRSLAYIQGLSDAGSSPESSLYVPEKSDVYIFDLQNRTKRRLTDVGDARSSAWSPDGTEIAYTRMNYLSGRIWVTGIDGTGSHVITPPADYAIEPLWSPDGEYIAYLNGPSLFNPSLYRYGATRESPADLVVIGPDGEDRRVLLTSVIRGSGKTIEWGANGDVIVAFNGTISWSDGSIQQESLWVCAAADQGSRYGTTINTGPFSIGEGWASLDPSKTSVVYIDNVNKSHLIRRLDSNGDKTTIFSNEICIDAVQYNPVTDRIAFINNYNLWSIDGDGSNLFVLADVRDHQGQVMNMRWSPDGSRIAYLDSGSLWIVDADGTNRRQISSYYSLGGFLDWSPDGRWVTFSYGRYAGTDTASARNGSIKKGAIVLIDAGAPDIPAEAQADGESVPGFTAYIASVGIIGVILLVRWRR